MCVETFAKWLQKQEAYLPTDTTGRQFRVSHPGSLLKGEGLFPHEAGGNEQSIQLCDIIIFVRNFSSHSYVQFYNYCACFLGFT